MRKLSLFLLVFLLVSKVVLADDGVWMQFGQNDQKTGISGEEFLPPIRMSMNWNVILPNGSDYESAPPSQSVVYNDKLYISFKDSNSSTKNEGIKIIGVDDGKTYDTREMKVTSSGGEAPYIPPPAIYNSENGIKLVAGDGNGSLQIFNLNSGLNRTIPLAREGQGIISPPTISDKYAILGSGASDVYVVDLDTERLKYTLDVKSAITCSPAVFNNQILFGDNKGYFYSYNLINGRQIFQIDPTTQFKISSSPCITLYNGIRYAVYGSSKGMVHRVTISNDPGYGGEDTFTAEKSDGDFEFWATPTVVNGFIFIGGSNGKFYKISLRDMTVVDVINLGQPIWSQATSSGDYLYVCTAEKGDPQGHNPGYLHVIKISTFNEVQKELQRIDSGSVTSPTIAGGYMFVSSKSGKIYRFEPTRGSLVVEPEEIFIGTLRVGPRGDGKQTYEFEIKNIGNKESAFSGSISILEDSESSSSWLSIDKPYFFETGKIKVFVDPSSQRPMDTEFKGKIIIKGDNRIGEAVVTVRVTFAKDDPFIQISDFNALNIGKIQQGPEVIRNFKVRLADGEKEKWVVLDFIPSDSWIIVSPTRITLDETGGFSIAVTIDTQKLPLGEKSGYIEIQGKVKNDPKTLKIPVRINILEQEARIITPERSKQEIVIKDCFVKETKTVSFTFSNDGGKFLVAGDVKSDVPWLKAKFDKDQDKETLNLICTITPNSDLWPGQTYIAKITAYVNDLPYRLEVVVKTNIPTQCKIEFIIGKTNYFVNGREIKMDAAPYISNKGSTMVPIRYISDPLKYFLGAVVEWIAELKTVLFTINMTTLRLVIGYSNAIIEYPEGTIDTKPLQSPPEIVKGRTFVPPRIIGETFGADVLWDAKTKKATFIFKTNPEE